MIAGSRCLVTGGAGFIGRHLVAGLVRRGAAEVLVLDRLGAGAADTATQSATCRAVVLPLGRGCLPALRPHLDGVDYVFHLAAAKHRSAQDQPESALDSNVDGTYCLARAAGEARVKRLVFASSLYMYGRMGGPPFSETETPLPDTIYGASKLAGEHLLRHCHSRYGLPYQVLRYFFTYGPGQLPDAGAGSVIAETCERLLDGRPPVVHGDGAQRFDYVYVSDVVAATIAAAESEDAGDVFNIGSGAGTSIADLIASLVAISGLPLPLVHADPDQTSGSNRVADIRNAADRLQWRPTTSLRDGLTMTYEWIAARRR